VVLVKNHWKQKVNKSNDVQRRYSNGWQQGDLFTLGGSIQHTPPKEERISYIKKSKWGSRRGNQQFHKVGWPSYENFPKMWEEGRRWASN
jgi:hypothetical protein